MSVITKHDMMHAWLTDYTQTLFEGCCFLIYLELQFFSLEKK